MYPWRDRLRDFWAQRLSALAAEVARGKRERRGRRDEPPTSQEKDER